MRIITWQRPLIRPREQSTKQDNTAASPFTLLSKGLSFRHPSQLSFAEQK